MASSTSKSGVSREDLKDLLDAKYKLYHRQGFIDSDPISIPHQFSRKEDIEISGLLAATLAWGQRVTILKSAGKLLEIMGNSPFEFVTCANKSDLEALNGFKHRTFNGDDAKAFVRGLKAIYRDHQGLEAVFSKYAVEPDKRIDHFRTLMLSNASSLRVAKHLSSPAKHSACKRLNMYLRWMVRPSGPAKVDFGIWKSIPASSLICPLDVHTGNVSRKLGILKRKQNDWQAAMELTAALKKFDAKDPVKYDFALFGMGVFEGF